MQPINLGYRTIRQEINRIGLPPFSQQNYDITIGKVETGCGQRPQKITVPTPNRMVYKLPEAELHDLKERIESRKGLHQLSYMKEMKMGNYQYELIAL